MFEASSLGGRRRKTSARRVVGTTCAPRGLDTSVLWVDSLSIFKTWSNFRKRGRKNPKRTKRETTAGSHTHTNPWKIPCASLNNKYIEKSLDDNDWLVGWGLQLQTEKNETSIKMSRISSIWEIENIPEGVSVVTATFLDRVWPCWNTRDAAEIFPAGHSRSVCVWEWRLGREWMHSNGFVIKRAAVPPTTQTRDFQKCQWSNRYGQHGCRQAVKIE